MRRHDQLTLLPNVPTQVGEAKRIHVIERLQRIIEQNERHCIGTRGPSQGKEVRKQCLTTRPLKESDIVMWRRGQRGKRRGPAPKPRRAARRSSSR